MKTERTQRIPAAGRRCATLWLAASVVAGVARVVVTAGPALAADVARGAAEYKLCAACHGPAGAGDDTRHAPAIAGLPAWYLDAQLLKFKEGQRAYHAEDTTGLQMRPMAKYLYTDADRADVVAYVASLPAVAPPAVSGGNAEKGKTLYTPCAACHGTEAQGNEQLKAPPLNHQADWYLVAQWKKFKDGWRGAAKGDVTGAQMRAMAAVVPDEQAMKDIAAYVRTLAK